MESMEKEVKIARILITISVIFGFFVVIGLFAIGMGGSGGRAEIARTGVLLLAMVKAVGLGFGLAAYLTLTRGDPRRAGRYALAASILPPFDLIALFAGLLALFSHGEGGVE